MARWKPFVRKDSYMPNNKMTPLVIGNGYTTDWGANGQPPVWDTAIGNPVSFNALTPFPLKQLSVAFSPVQDLHGYDSPWPAGGGANKWDEEWLVGYISNADGVIHESSGQTRIVSKNKIPVQPSTEYYIAGTASVTVYGYAEDESYVSSITVSSRKFTTPANVYYVCFETSSAYGNTYNHDIAINYPSSVTTYSPYSNECPISGWDGVTVEQRGKNLLNVSQANEVRKNGASYFTLEYANNSVTMRCDRVLALNVVWEAFRIKKCHVGKTFTISGTFTGSAIYIARTQNKDGDWTPSPITLSSTTRTYTITEEDVGRAIGLEFYNATGADQTASDLQLELGSTATDYVPYNPSSRSISISFGQTVYSGTLDVLTGVVTVTWAAVDMGTKNWTRREPDATYPYGYFTTTISGKKAGESNLICDSYPTRSITYNDMSIWGNGASIRIYITNTNYSDETTFKNSLNGVQLVYELATPITIQLTPQEVESLAGDNTMWSNANQPITVEYRKN